MSLDRKINRIQFLSGNSLKVIAVLTMLIDHLCKIVLQWLLSNYWGAMADNGQMSWERFREIVEMSRNVQSGNTQNLKSMVIQRSFPKWSVAERRKTAAASDQAAVCACAHSRYFAGGSPSGLRV